MILDLVDKQALLAAEDTDARLTLELEFLRREVAMVKQFSMRPAVELPRAPTAPTRDQPLGQSPARSLGRRVAAERAAATTGPGRDAWPASSDRTHGRNGLRIARGPMITFRQTT